MPSPQRHGDASATHIGCNNKGKWGVFPHEIDFSDSLLAQRIWPVFVIKKVFLKSKSDAKPG